MADRQICREACRLYGITKYGDIFAGGMMDKHQPRCTARLKTFNKCHEFVGIPEKYEIAFTVGTSKRFMRTDGFENGYPTAERPRELYDESRRLRNRLYVEQNAECRRLVLETFAVLPVAQLVSISIPVLTYTVTCQNEQENTVAGIGASDTSSIQLCRFASLAYKVTVELPGGHRSSNRAFEMEQTLGRTESGEEYRTLAIYGLEHQDDLTPALLLARIITLTGYPSDAKPIEIAKGARV